MLKIFTLVSSGGEDPAQWARDNCARGFDAYEAVIRECAGKFSVGDEVTAADVVLGPQCWNAEM